MAQHEKDIVPIKSNNKWCDLSKQLGLAILRNILEDSYPEAPFIGITEADLVFILSNILNSCGYKCNHEYKYPNGFRKVDILANNWLDETIYCETKVIYDKDNRLNKKRYYVDKREILKDIENISKIVSDSSKLTGFIVFVAFSNSKELNFSLTPQNNSLQEILNDIAKYCQRKPRMYHYLNDLHNMFEIYETGETKYKYMHVIVSVIQK